SFFLHAAKSTIKANANSFADNNFSRGFIKFVFVNEYCVIALSTSYVDRNNGVAKNYKNAEQP
ncbi:MAG TPA: hypothetical protein VFV68_05135, partial [Agriterribacter sp.]|nr:hypothetical protein [Agriterribacter sp.]